MQRGLGLIELLIVLALMGMLAAIAYPSYRDSLRRAARSEVVGLLHDAALRLELQRTRVGGYADDGPLTAALPAGTRYYRLQAQRERDRYRLLASRLPGALMAHDPCGDYVLDHAGVRDNPGAGEGREHCWGS